MAVVVMILAALLAVDSGSGREQHAIEEVLEAHERAMHPSKNDQAWMQALQDRPLEPEHQSSAEQIEAITGQRARSQVESAVTAIGGTLEQARALASTFGNSRERHPDEPAQAPGTQLVIFVSQSMPDAELAQIATTMPANAVMVFRGMLDGQDLAMLSMRIKGWADDPAELGAVQLDPRPFQELGVARAPAIGLREGAQWQGLVYGTAQPGYLLEQLQAGKRGELGQVGPTLDVIEEDLLAKMQREMPDQIRARAKTGYEQFLSKVDVHDIGEAVLYRERMIDPSVVVSEDFVLPDGVVIARAGDRINPFAHRPFRTRLIIVDLRVPWQKAFAKLVARQSLGRHRVMVLASNLDVPEGWKDYHALNDEIDQHIFLLTDEIAERFSINAVPAVVDGAGDRIRVRVYPRDRFDEGFHIDGAKEG